MNTAKNEVNSNLREFIVFLIVFLSTNLLLIIIRILWNSTLIFDQLLLIGIFSIVFFLLILRFFRFSGLGTIGFLVLSVVTSVLLIFQVVGNVDRSRSLFILSWVKEYDIQCNSKLDLSEIQSSETKDLNGVVQRIEEHKKRKLLKESQGGWCRLTSTGLFVYNIADFLAGVYSLDGWAKNRL